MILRFIFLVSTVAFLFSCLPKVKSRIFNKQGSLSDTSIIAVIDPETTFNGSGLQVGAVQIGDGGFSTHCAYSDVIKILRLQARANGANVIRITEHRQPDALSTCHRIKADLYLVADPRKFETEITWSKDRKLVWEDFKGEPDPLYDEQVAALTYCTFGYQARKSMIGKAQVNVENTFDCYKSWVRPEHRGHANILKHEQVHFDIAEIFSRKLRRKLSEPNLNVYGFNDGANAIYQEIAEEYQKRQNAYDIETGHSINTINQDKWNKMIEKELAASE